MKHTLIIKPAIPPEKRHKLEDQLTLMGYEVYGGGTGMDMSECDISFNDDDKQSEKRTSNRH